jgi:hypothetical protein
LSPRPKPAQSQPKTHICCHDIEACSEQFKKERENLSRNVQKIREVRAPHVVLSFSPSFFITELKAI